MTPSNGFLTITTVRSQSSGGETYRVETTGETNRPAFRLPHTPHHNSDARVQTTIKNTLAACVCRGFYPGSQSRRQILLACWQYSPGYLLWSIVQMLSLSSVQSYSTRFTMRATQQFSVTLILNLHNITP